jgi:hypothetical protein
MAARDAMKWTEMKCPFCREAMRIDASVCPHCTRAVAPEDIQRFQQGQGGFGTALIGAAIMVGGLLILGIIANWLF